MYCGDGQTQTGMSGNLSPCMALLVQDGAHASIVLFGTVRLIQMCCGKKSTSRYRMRTTGELLQLIKILISCLLTILPGCLLAARAWDGFQQTTLNNLKGMESQILIDVAVRSACWLYCFLLLLIAQQRRLPESPMLCLWWIVLLGGCFPLFRDIIESKVKVDGEYYTWSRGEYIFSYMCLIGINICMIIQPFFVLKGRKSHHLLPRDDSSIAIRPSTPHVRVNSKSAPTFLEDRRGTQLWDDRWIDLSGEGEVENDTQFKDLRYTAVNNLRDPMHFHADGYKLRCYSMGYKIKLLIGVTVESESPEEFNKTLRGVCENLKHLTNEEGDEVWKEVLLCVIVDGKQTGRGKTDEGLLSFAASLGMYDEDLIAKAKTEGAAGEEKDSNDEPDVTNAHVFEYTAQVEEDLQFNKFFPPLQVVFTLKEQKAGRMDSHMWFFDAFAAQIAPEYCFLTHAGVIPAARAIYKLYRALEINEDYGVVCGEVLTKGNVGEDWVVSAQAFDFKVSHVLDRSLEGLCGYLTLMPVEFVAYRYTAIANRDGVGPLEKYFRGLRTPLRGEEVSRRVLRYLETPPDWAFYHCPEMVLRFEMMMQPERKWVCQYVKNAKAVVKVPLELAEFVSDRATRRIALMFSLFYNVRHFAIFWEGSGHKLSRKISVAFIHIFWALQFTLEWFYIALFYLAFSQLVNQMAAPCVSFEGDTIHQCWKVTNFGTINHSYGIEVDSTMKAPGLAIPQCRLPYKGYPEWSCYGPHEPPIEENEHGFTVIHLPANGLNGSEVERQERAEQFTNRSLLSLTFQNTTQILTLWSGETNCYHPLQAGQTKEKKQENLEKFNRGQLPSCCLPAVVERCGKGTVFSSSGAFDVEYECRSTGCGVGIDKVVIMRMVFQSIYMLVVLTTVVIGLGNQTRDVVYETKLVSFFYGAMIYMMAIIYVNYLIADIEDNCFGIPTEWIATGTFVLLGYYMIGGFIQGELHNLVSSWGQYFFLWPSLVNICHILAFSRLDRIRTGHSMPAGATYSPQEDRPKMEHAKGTALFQKKRGIFRSKLLLLWLITNACAILAGDFLPAAGDSIYALIWVIAAFLMTVRLVGSVGFQVLTKYELLSASSQARITEKNVLAEAEKEKRGEAVEKRRRKFEYKSLEMYLDDVNSDEMVQRPMFLSPRTAARLALEKVYDNSQTIRRSVSFVEFDLLVDRSRALTHELQLLSIERRKLTNLEARLANIAEQCDLKPYPTEAKKLKHAQNALTNARETTWADLGDWTKLRARVAKADSKLIELRNVETGRRLTEVKQAERALEEFSQSWDLKEAEGGSEALTDCKVAIEKAKSFVDGDVGNYREASENMRDQLDDLKLRADRAKIDKRMKERDRWQVVSDLLQRLSEPATSPECLDDDDLDAAVHKAHEKMGDLQAAIVNSKDEFDRAENEAKLAVEDAVKKHAKTLGKHKR